MNCFLNYYFITETYKLCYLYNSRAVLETILKSTLKRQLPYLIGGTITGIFISYYYGILFSIIVNSIIWFAISTIVNKYYWHYTGFKDEFYLVSKYVINRKKNKINQDYGLDEKDHKKESQSSSSDLESLSENNNGKTSNIGSPIKL
jgi:hypothetical protein